MKKFIFSALILSAAVTSCSKSEIEQDSQLSEFQKEMKDLGLDDVQDLKPLP